MKDNTKTTSKREYAFVINSAVVPNDPTDPEKEQIFRTAVSAVGFGASIKMIDKDKNVLRTFQLSKLPAEVLAILVVHGLKQKMTDDTMVSKIGEDGDRLLACDDLWLRLVGGEWEKEREGLARPPEAVIILIMEKKSVEREVAVASLKQIGKEGWDKIAEKFATDIKAIQERINKAKSAASALDLEDLK